MPGLECRGPWSACRANRGGRALPIINRFSITHRGGGYRGEYLPFPTKSFLYAAAFGGCCVLEHDMTSRPSDLAELTSSRRETDSSFSREMFRLPVELARAKAREILGQSPQNDYLTIIDQWRQLPDGRIEFTMRRLRAAD